MIKSLFEAKSWVGNDGCFSVSELIYIFFLRSPVAPTKKKFGCGCIQNFLKSLLKFYAQTYSKYKYMIAETT